MVCFIAGCAGLPGGMHHAPSYAMRGGNATSLERIALRAAEQASTSDSGFRVLTDAAFALDARISLIRKAERSVDVQYYLIRSDDVGLLFLKELRDAAMRGVRVRLLVDDLYASGEDELFSSLSAFPNIEIRLFNPLPSRVKSMALRLVFSLSQISRINHRMHNKLLVADDTFAVSGGRNIANDYFMQDNVANFIDVDVLSNGPIVHEMSNVFDKFWNSKQVRTISEVAPSTVTQDAARIRFNAIARGAIPDVQLNARDALGRRSVGEQLSAGDIEMKWAYGRVYADRADKLDRAHEDAFNGSVAQGALDAIATSEREVLIISPYFIPGANGMKVLTQLISRGGSVSVITNSLSSTDEPLAYAGYERYTIELLKAGAALYEIAPDNSSRARQFGDFGDSLSRLHAKVTVIDGKQIFIGSMNLDHRSASINTEFGLLIESPDMAAELHSLLSTEHFELGYKLTLAPDGRRIQWVTHDGRGDHIVYEDVPGSHPWLRLKNWLLLPLLGGEELL